MGWKKMEPEQLIDLKKYKGQVFEGTFRKTKEIPSRMADSGKQLVHEFEIEKGVFTVYGFGQLDAIMRQADPGMKLRIKYLGTKNMQTKGGFKDVHQCEVMCLEGRDDQPSPQDQHNQEPPPWEEGPSHEGDELDIPF